MKWLAAGLAICAAGAAAEPAGRFSPARYRGLVLGASTRAEAWRVFGRPDSSGPLEDSPAITVASYRRRPITRVWIEKGRVVYIAVTHALPWTREALALSFGPGWRLTTSGSQQFWENRSLGLINELGAKEIEYLSAPLKEPGSSSLPSTARPPDTRPAPRIPKPPREPTPRQTESPSRAKH